MGPPSGWLDTGRWKVAENYPRDVLLEKEACEDMSVVTTIWFQFKCSDDRILALKIAKNERFPPVKPKAAKPEPDTDS